MMIQVFRPLPAVSFVLTGEPGNPWRCFDCLTTSQLRRLGKPNVVRYPAASKDIPNVVPEDCACRVCQAKFA